MKARSIIFKTVLFSFFVFLAFSCSKDRITPLRTETPATETKDSTDEIFLSSSHEVLERFAATPTSKVINKPSDMPFIGKEGTEVYAYENTFVLPNGQFAAFPIKLEVIELFTPKEMILNQMPTVSDGRLLTTAGEINIKAYKDGQELRLNPWSSMRVVVPSTSVDNSMSLFYGTPQPDGTVNWVEAEFREGEGQDSSRFSRIIPSKENYQIFPTQIGWINCDKFYSYTGAKTKVRFTSIKPKITSIIKFLYFDNIKSVVQVYGDESLEVPVGEHVKLICIASKTNGELYSYTSEFNVQQDQVVDVKVVKTTEDNFLAYLSSL